MSVKNFPDDSSLLKIRALLLRSRKELEGHALLAHWWEVFKKSLGITDEQAIARTILEFLADVLLDEEAENTPTMRELLNELSPELRKELLTTFITTFKKTLFTPKSKPSGPNGPATEEE